MFFFCHPDQKNTMLDPEKVPDPQHCFFTVNYLVFRCILFNISVFLIRKDPGFWRDLTKKDIVYVVLRVLNMIKKFFVTCTYIFWTFFVDPDFLANRIRTRAKGPGSETLIIIVKIYNIWKNTSF